MKCRSRWSRARPAASERRWRSTLTLDDSGSRSTGRLQGSATLSLDNPLRLNDLFYVGASGAVGMAGDREPGPRGNRAWSAHYEAPFGRWLASTSFSRSRFHQSVAGANQAYLYSGHSDTGELRLARVVHRDATTRTSVYGRVGYNRATRTVNVAREELTEVMRQLGMKEGFDVGLEMSGIRKVKRFVRE